MPRSSSQQVAFLGGEWSPLSQGRVADPRYAQALNLCRNSIVSEEGAVVRRPGTQRIAPTYGRLKARLLKFISSTRCAFAVEATPGNLRFYDGPKLVFTNDQRTVSTSSYASNNITLGLDASHGWSVGDQVMLQFPAGYAVSSEATCRGLIMQLLTGSTGSTLVLGNDVGGALGVLSANFTANTSLVGATVFRVKRFTTSYTASDIPNLRMVQAQTQGIILASDVAPQAVGVTEAANQDPVFSFSALTMVDGPYLDPSGDTGTVSALTGTVTFTATSTTPFASTDVGRSLRLFSQPALWASGTTYSAGNNVTDSSGAWWTSLINSNTGNTPGQPVTIGGVQQLAWAPAPQAGSWAWGLITTYHSSSSVSVAIDTTIPNMVLQTGNGTTISLFQLGVYNSVTGYPTSGAYYEGRLYLFGAVPNRLDTSMANGFTATSATTGTWQFSPTDPWDNVLDDSGISEVLNSKFINIVYWAEPDQQGVIIGTDSGEWLVSASTLGDPITPSTIQAHPVTAFRSEDVEPARAPMAMIFPQAYGRRVIEYLADAFTQRLTGKGLNDDARHMTPTGIARIDYQSEPIPVVWALVNDGSLIGCTYRRISRFVTEPPAVFGWHKHAHGSGGQFSDIAILPAAAGGGDLFFAEVFVNGSYFVELVQPSLEVNPLQSVRDGWFVDSSPGNAPSLDHICGNLTPSIGFSGSGSGTWTLPAIPATPLLAAGTTLPPAPYSAAFVALNNGCYLNGWSALYNFGPSRTVTNMALSVWLYVVSPGQGSLFGVPGLLDQYPLLGNPGFPNLAFDALGSNPPNWNNPSGNWLAAGNELGGQWINLLISAQSTNFGNGAEAVVYFNDTAVSSPTDACFFPSGGVTSGSMIFGGAAQAQLNPAYPNTNVNTELVNTDNYGNPIPTLGPAGMVAGIAELWVSWTHSIDFSVQANRRLFNTTDLPALRYAPVNLGTNGQLPLSGTKPDIYLSGPPNLFRYNRANGLQITTYNAGALQYSTQQIDPSLVTLDPLPAFIAPVS